MLSRAAETGEPPPPPGDLGRLRSDRLALALLAFAALVRLLFLLETPAVDFRHLRPNDAAFHDDMARTISGGNWLLLDTPGVAVQRGAEDAVALLGSSRFAHEFAPHSYTKYPGYDYLVAVFYRLLGPDTRGVYVFQEALDLLACALTYLIGLRLYDRTVARGALALAAATGPLVLYAGTLLRETVLGSLLVLLVYLLVRARDPHRGLGAWAAAGVGFGLAWIVKPSVLPLAPFLLPSFLETGSLLSRRMGSRVAVFALAAFATASPLFARNLALGLPPFRMATNEFVAVLGFNCPGAGTRGLDMSPSLVESARRAALRCERPSLLLAAREVIAEHGGPLGPLRLETARLANALVADDAWDDVRYSYLEPCLLSLRLAPVRWKLIASFVLLGGVLALAQDPRRRAIVLGPPALVLVTCALSECTTRYRIFGDHLHALLAASAFVWLYREARRKHARAIVAVMAALLASQALHDPVPPPAPYDIARYMVSSFGAEEAAPLLRHAGITIR